MRMRLSAALAAIVLLAASAAAAEKGKLKLDVMGETGALTKAVAEIQKDGKKVAEVAIGKTVELDPGTYRLVLPFVGGKIKKEDLKIVGGRTRTVLITDLAVLTVKAKDLKGNEPGFGVLVTNNSPPHDKVAEFISGDSILIGPSKVDVKIDAPPQGHYWPGIELPPGRHAVLELNETQQAELAVQPVLSKLPLDKESRVIIYKAGTQSQVAVSEPAAEHKFKLDQGDYDIYVENHSGKGQPFITDRAVHLNWGDKVERKVALDGEAKSGH